jgi:putative ABC transport system permease protein
LLVATRWTLFGRFEWLGYLSPICAVVGCALAGPWLASSLIRLSRRTVSPRGPFGGATVFLLAADNLLRNPKRTASNLLSLMVGLMLVILIASIHGSFEDAISSWEARTLQYDVIVSSTGRVASSEVQPLHESLADELATVPGIDGGVRALRFAHATYAGRRIGVKAMDPSHPRVASTLFDTIDIAPSDAERLLFRSDVPTVLVSRNFADHFGKHTGDSLEMDTPLGRVAFGVAATVMDYSDPEGVVYFARSQYKHYFNDPLVTAFGIEVASGVRASDLRDAIDERFGQRGVVAILNESLRAQTTEYLDETFAYTRAVEFAALAVGLIGLLNTVLVSLMERSRELGMLRAIGMSRGQLVGMILLENIVVGAFGGAAAVTLGAYVADVWIVNTLARSLGWYVDPHVPADAVLGTLAAGIVVGMLAGLWAAYRMSSLTIREALECG